MEYTQNNKMASISSQIKQKALEIIRNSPQGIRYSQLLKLIIESFPNVSSNTIRGVIWNLDATIPDEIYKADRGLFRHISFRETPVTTEEVTVTPQRTATGIREEDFYDLFRDYLINDLEECTKAVSLGGNRFRDKWGTPDVI